MKSAIMFLFVLALLCSTAFGQHIQASQADITTANAAVIKSGVNNAVYFPTQCASSMRPSWCSGSDLGAWVNAAATACTSCRIHIPAGSCTSFTTPISFGSGQFVTLEGDPGGGSCLKFTPSTGVAILFDPGVSEHQAYGIRDLQLIGPGSGTSTTGVELGSSNGAEGLIIRGFRTGTSCCGSDGFGTGIVVNTASAFLVTVQDSFVQANGTGLSITTGLENLRLLNNNFTHNSTNAILATSTGWTDIYSFGNSYDDNGPISLPAAGGIGNQFTSAGDHFENASVGGAAQPYITIANNSHLTMTGDVMLDDRASGTNTGQIACSGASLVYIYGMARGNGGITVNPFLAAWGRCRAWMQFSQSTGTYTDYSPSYRSGGIFDSGFTFAGSPALTLMNGVQGANTSIPYGSNVTTGLTGNMSSTQLGATTTVAGMYLVCVSMFPTATGSATSIQARVSSNDGTLFTTDGGSALSLASASNVGGGCLPIPAASGVNIDVATSGYSGTGTYTVRSVVQEIQ